MYSLAGAAEARARLATKATTAVNAVAALAGRGCAASTGTSTGDRLRLLLIVRMEANRVLTGQTGDCDPGVQGCWCSH
jgi:hypothetical protein